MNSRESGSPVNTSEWESVSPVADDNDGWIDVLNNGDLLRRVIVVQKQQPDDEYVLTNDVDDSSEGPSQEKGQQEKPAPSGDDDSSTGTRPKMGDKVKVKVSGVVCNGGGGPTTKIDDHEELEFVVGLSDVIQAFEMVVQFMAVNEVNEVKVKSRMAYGDAGREPDIPPKATVFYTIQLLSFEPGPDIYNMNVNDRIDYCEKRKDRGNYYFKRHEYSQAVELYTKSLQAADVIFSGDLSSEERVKFNAVRVALYNNLSATHLKTGNWDGAVEATESCLKIEPDNAKTLYRRAKGHQGKRDFDEALKFYERIVKLGHEIKDVKDEIAKCKIGAKNDQERLKRMYGRMMRGDDDSTTKKQSGRYSLFSVKKLGLATLIGAAGVGAALFFRFLSKQN